MRAEFERASAEMRAIELTVVQEESDAQNAAAALEVAQRSAKELADRQRLLGDLNNKKRLHDELDRAYTDLRTDLNFQLRPELSELASAFLSDLTDGRYGELELDDNYDIKVLEDGVPKPVISGGEEDLANLVLRLAISQMIAERAGQPFALLVLDEIFGSLDDLASRERARPAAPAAGPLRAGDPHHAHRERARHARPRDHRALQRGDVGVGGHAAGRHRADPACRRPARRCPSGARGSAPERRDGRRPHRTRGASHRPLPGARRRTSPR